MLRRHQLGRRPYVLIETRAADLASATAFKDNGARADLVVTSPPYPGIHMLYHRWQVDGRRESPAPYWILHCEDGEGASFYTFGGRENLDGYCNELLSSLRAIRKVMKRGAMIIQMIAFGDPRRQLSRYLSTMQAAGFVEIASGRGPQKRIWRSVPNRKWHATFKGRTHSSREVVLIHRAA